MHVLIATDGSESSLDACRLVTRLLVPGRDHVRLMTVLSYELYPGSLVPGEHMADEGASKDLVDREVERVTSAGRRILEEARLTPTIAYRFGNPADEIAAEVEHWTPDIVVVGRRGVRGFERLLGSVSQHLSHHVRGAALLIVP